MPVPRDSDDPADENSYYRHQDFHETVSSTLTRSRYFADSIVSPYVRPRVPNVPSFRDLFRSRYLAARHAAATYRVSGTTIAAPQLYHTNGPQERIVAKYTCATVVADDESPPAVDLKDVSFVFELFGDVDLYAGHIVTDSLRDRDMGLPHFACRDEKDLDLLWAATVRASEDGLVQALVPLDDQGRLALTHSVPVDLGGTINRWCESWRLVVTAVRDDGKMCQIIDVRDKRDIGFRDEGDEGTDGGSCYFRVAELGGDSESLECKVHFGVNACHGPASQGFVHRYYGCNAACYAHCARRRGELGDGAVDERGVYLMEPGWMYSRNQAQRDFRAFLGNAVEPGSMFQITISWLYDSGWTRLPDGTELDCDLSERLTVFPGSTIARRLNNPGYSRVPDDDEPFLQHVRMVESKLARLHWA
jgi:hypothetical protein